MDSHAKSRKIHVAQKRKYSCCLDTGPQMLDCTKILCYVIRNKAFSGLHGSPHIVRQGVEARTNEGEAI